MSSQVSSFLIGITRHEKGYISIQGQYIYQDSSIDKYVIYEQTIENKRMFSTQNVKISARSLRSLAETTM